MSDLQGFWSRINSGPAVLFLGQSYLKLDTGVDPFLTEVQSKYGGSITSNEYDILFDGTASQYGDSAYGWMTERCRRILPPAWLQIVASYQWSAVHSSAIEPIWQSAFWNEWREVWPVLDEHYFPRDPRNRRMLHCTYLFGSISQTEMQQQSPLSKLQFLSRKPVAINLARRLPDILTPLGTLAIEGYAGDNDWFSISDFYPVLHALNPGQAHFFNASEQTNQNEILDQLVREGKVILHSESLSWALQHGADQGLITLGSAPEKQEEARLVILKTENISIPRDIWNRVANSATVLTADIMTTPHPMSADARYWEFRRFLFESGSRPVWSGYANNFAFIRDFEKSLHAMVIRRLNHEPTSDKPIIAHGQTGTGKTVALGRLSFEVARSHKYPVFFIEHRIQRPVYADLDQCCQYLEDHGAPACLIVWDGMLQPSDYSDIQRYFSGRGRKIVVVGSSYKLQIKGDNLFEIPDCLTSDESARFVSHLEFLGIPVHDRLRKAIENCDTSYLVALYRLLPPARPRIRAGVVEELESTEKGIESSIISQLSKAEPDTTLARAFIAAGIIDEARLHNIKQRSATTKIRPGDVQELVDLVMVPGRLGINIPIELLVRTWGKSDFSDIGNILNDFDIFRTNEDLAGRVLVGPRHRLEATLLVDARLGSIEAEVSTITKLVKNIRSSISSSDDSDEIGFAVEIMRAVGPRGQEDKGRFRPFYPKLYDALRDLRETRNIRNPRLILQEANLMREWVTLTSQAGAAPADSLDILSNSKTILQEALDILENNRRNQMLRESLATELATTLAARTVDLINRHANIGEVLQAYRESQQAIRLARSIDFTHYYPIDVLIWLTTAIVQSPALEGAACFEAIADVLDAMQTIDTEILDTTSIEIFHRRKIEIGRLVGDNKMSDSAFEDLIAMGSTAGYYIRALEIGGQTRDITIVDDSLAQQYLNAWQYLENQRIKIAQDARCLNLLFDYWWLSKARQALFFQERTVLPFKDDEWSYCLQLLTNLKSLPGSYRNLTLSFLQGVSIFHLNQSSQAIQQFREVENESYILHGKRRICKYYLAGDQYGKPRIYHGRISMIEAEGRRGQVTVDEIRQRVAFFPLDFGQPDIRQGDSLGTFHIAFNFLGLVADPSFRR